MVRIISEDTEIQVCAAAIEASCGIVAGTETTRAMLKAEASRGVSVPKSLLKKLQDNCEDVGLPDAVGSWCLRLLNDESWYKDDNNRDLRGKYKSNILGGGKGDVDPRYFGWSWLELDMTFSLDKCTHVERFDHMFVHYL